MNIRSFPRVAAALVTMAAFVLPAICAAETFRIDPARSTITFKVRQYLGTVSGRFQQFSGEIEFDREQPEQSKVRATIQVRSIKTGIAKRDQHLPSPEFFNVDKYPDITFQSRRVKQTGKESGEITGDLTMHGVTKPVTLQVRFLGFTPSKGGGQTTRWRVTTDPLKRDDYALRWSDTTERVSGIAQQVAVEMEIEATP